MRQPSKLDTWVRFPYLSFNSFIKRAYGRGLYFASIAQLVERFVANEKVVGSYPTTRFIFLGNGVAGSDRLACT